MVVDEYGIWMERWRQQFAGLGIEWLRSLVTAHPHPYDEDALLSFAYANGLADQVRPGMLRMAAVCNLCAPLVFCICRFSLQRHLRANYNIFSGKKGLYSQGMDRNFLINYSKNCRRLRISLAFATKIS
jgi:hypothetical protein